MKRKFLILGLGITVGLGSLVSPNFNTALAAGNKQLENQKNDVENKRSDVESEIDSKESEVNQLKAEQEAVAAEIKRLDFAVGDTKSEIREKEAQIEESRLEVVRLQAEIEATKERIAKRDELLKNRMNSIQESGGVISYLDVILGAQSFSDFLNRVNAVSSFVKADQDIIKAHTEDKKLLENSEVEIKEKLIGLEQNLTKLEGMIKKLNGQIAEQSEIKKKLKIQEEEMHGELAELENQVALYAAQEKAVEREIAEWNKREEERKRQEEERKRQEEANKNSSTPSTSSGNQLPTVSNGAFMNPATGRLSSPYGQRWGKLHAGIDIGKGGRSGDIPIVASATGTVIRSNYSSSYGNVVMISHYIDGQVMTTLYAHMENRFVSEGERIEKGTVLGYMGNTGQSKGAHLHFEIHLGPWNGSANSVNPLRYVSY
ncbi:murein hydrolase activator EnvC family protein [Bacillus sp. DJP31]|uniref:murein hydrolase activator EnvC family protein n=1 Tax=Bacillus sp. DJP31 TaxID=3409789 RepID=UPI003BB80418